MKHFADSRISLIALFFFSSRRRHTRFDCDWSSDVCSSDLLRQGEHQGDRAAQARPRDEGHVTPRPQPIALPQAAAQPARAVARSEEHTSELQSQSNLVCRLLLEKKKTTIIRVHKLQSLHRINTT